MLSKNQVVIARKAVEELYEGVCSVVEYQKYTRENRSTGYREVLVAENLPCRLSYRRKTAADQTEGGAAVGQEITVFLAPETEIKPGSKLIITQNGITEEYQCSGKPAVYQTHQEVYLEIFEGWA